jgi:UDP-N-acetylglucosamine 3-dehydrogenase
MLHEARKLRVAIIGTGNIADAHARGFKANAAEAEVVAVCDVDEQRAGEFAAKHDFGTVYTDLTSLLGAEQPDAVSICTPNYLHAPQSIQALESGTHVLCEKPMATNLTDAEAMKAAAEWAGRVLYIGFNHRFIGKFNLAKQLLDSGEYGRLLAARIALGHGMYERLSRTWFGNSALSGGGTLIDNGVHMIDMLRWYGGSITAISAQAHRLLATEGDVEDNAIAVMQLANGGIASLQCSWTWPPKYTLLFSMICEHGTLDLSGNEVVAFKSGDEAPCTLDTPVLDHNAEQVRAFLAAARGDQPPFVTPDDGLAAVRVALSAYESSKTGRTVTL